MKRKNGEECIGFSEKEGVGKKVKIRKRENKGRELAKKSKEVEGVITLGSDEEEETKWMGNDGLSQGNV